MTPIYHITSGPEWRAAKEMGSYAPASLATEGFIHCSGAAQLAGVLERYFAGRQDLVQLEIDPDRLTAPLKYEWAASVNEAFPHVYGPINLGAVIAVAVLRP